ncbi:MAG TPA: permease-like cell division protein FtsX [Flavobacteriales bacterium]|nr:permease-like cell division protein FtsX [Flavobacteriales bacterium]HJN63897.1 permease-like cell division protein FtsX [Flavobacteriales bacterium]
MSLKNKIKSSSMSIVISMSLVLFVLGILGFLLINANRLSNHVKQNIGFSVMIKEGVKDVDIMQLQKLIDSKAYSLATDWVSKEDAATELQEQLGEDFISFLGYNPLLESIDIKLKATYANPDSLLVLQEELTKNDLIHEVFYQKDLIEKISKNMRKMSIFLLSFFFLLFIISFTLINNTIRISVYSKRFLIRTMKLVGATNKFIKGPFLSDSIYNGVYSSLVTICMLLAVFQLLQSDMPDFLNIQDLKSMGIIFASIFVAGILFTWLSTFFALRKYLRIKESEIYL